MKWFRLHKTKYDDDSEREDSADEEENADEEPSMITMNFNIKYGVNRIKSMQN
jgi:hypothetical protein